MTAQANIPEQHFIERIEKLDPGELAALRRGCGGRDSVEGRCPWLIGEIRGAAREPVAFLVASLMAQYKTSVIHAGQHRLEGNFGVTWRAALLKNAPGARSLDDDRISKSIKRRFHILLDADYDPFTGDGDLPYRLRQMVRYAASKGVGVDWAQLLLDVKFWGRPERRAQKEWAQSFFVN